MRSLLLLCMAMLCLHTTISAQGTAINTTGSAPDASAMLDVSSTSKGLLPPRMTAAQIASISSPATGLVAYQTDGTTGLYINNGTSGSPNWQLVGPMKSSAYGSYYYSNTSSTAVVNNGDMPFTSVSASSGIGYGLTTFTIGSTGAYRIVMNFTKASANAVFAIYVNGAVANGATYGNVSSTSAFMGDVILPLTAGDVIEIRNVTGATVFLSPPASGVNPVIATLNITQIQ